MGSAASFKLGHLLASKKTAQEILILFPDYEANVVLSKNDIVVIDETWGMIINDKISHCLNLSQYSGASASFCGLNFFYDSFFRILFEMSDCKPTIEASSMKLSIKSIANVITTVISILKEENIAEFKEKMEYVASTHGRYGVRPEQYPFVCEVLVLTLRFCLSDEWEQTSCHSWIRLFSLMLDFIVPAALFVE